MVDRFGLLTREEVEALRPVVRKKIAAGELPSTRVPMEIHDARGPGSRHLDCCRVCGQVIGFEELPWYRLDYYQTDAPDPHQRGGPFKPELHANCHAAWEVEVMEMERQKERGGGEHS